MVIAPGGRAIRLQCWFSSQGLQNPRGEDPATEWVGLVCQSVPYAWGWVDASAYERVEASTWAMEGFKLKQQPDVLVGVNSSVTDEETNIPVPKSQKF